MPFEKQTFDLNTELIIKIMIAEINKDGVLIITPKNETEIYAVKKWHEEQKELSDKVKIFLKTELE